MKVLHAKTFQWIFLIKIYHKHQISLMLPWFSILRNSFALAITSTILKISLKYVDRRDTQTETQHTQHNTKL